MSITSPTLDARQKEDAQFARAARARMFSAEANDPWWYIASLVDVRTLVQLFASNRYHHQLFLTEPPENPAKPACMKGVNRGAAFFKSRIAEEGFPDQVGRTIIFPIVYLGFVYFKRYQDFFRAPEEYSQRFLQPALSRKHDELKKNLVTFQSEHKDAWRQALAKSQQVPYSLVRLIMAQRNQELFTYLYSTLEIPRDLVLHNGNTAFSYAVRYDWKAAAEWFLEQRDFQVRCEDLGAAIVSEVENDDLMRKLLTRVGPMPTETSLKLLLLSLEFKKLTFAKMLMDGNPPLIKSATTRLQETRRFDLYYRLHRCLDQLHSLKAQYPTACRLLKGLVPAEELKESSVEHGQASLDWGFLRIVALYSPRAEAHDLLNNLLLRFDLKKEFLGGALFIDLFNQRRIDVPVCETLIDATGRSYEMLEPQVGFNHQTNSNYSFNILSALLKQSGKALSQAQTMKLAKRMIRRWGNRLHEFFNETTNFMPSTYNHALSKDNLQELHQYYYRTRELLELVRALNLKALKGWSGEPSLADLRQDALAGLNLGFVLNEWHVTVLRDLQAEKPRWMTLDYLSRCRANTVPEVLDKLIVYSNKSIFARTFTLTGNAILILRENEWGCSIRAFFRWVDQYVEFLRDCRNGKNKAEALEKARQIAWHHFEHDMDRFGLDALAEVLRYDSSKLLTTIRNRRDHKTGVEADWDEFEKTFPGIGKYLEDHPVISPKTSPRVSQIVASKPIPVIARSNGRSSKHISTPPASNTPVRIKKRREEGSDSEDNDTLKGLSSPNSY